MAHPLLTAHPRLIAALGLTGALLIPAAPVIAVGLAPVDATTSELVCDSVVVIDPACTAVDQAIDGALGMAAPLTGPTGELIAPLADQLPTDQLPIDQLPTEVLPGPVGELVDGAVLGGDTGGGDDGPQAPAPSSGGGSPAVGTPEAPAVTEPQSGEPTKVETAGKGPEEVAEPQAPVAADGRVAGGPTLQPLDVSAMGGNIEGIRSQNGVTLQPFDAPLVSTPMDFEAPLVAGVPVTTASPTAALATQVVNFAGEAVLPQTTGAAGWVTATGLGMVAAAAVTLRRRLTTLSVGTLDD